MGIKDLSSGFVENIGRMSDILNPGEKKSGANAYYSRIKEPKDSQSFTPPIIGKKDMSLDEEELYEDGIHEIGIELAIQNLS